ncbi:methyltransferase domain-containing protein [Solitalea sp. MAHUQ-68]|uniref:Methyltransferase domain-containing protein n=1 Tax=Solitalea agri TaxID=2953739 RepID=A0A9X2F3G6_9SPHI|nr:methyltransferase domain-containing protein [Solitalea agri]MCO4293550.1 methyltransferase domain-containing protein [Solitalea agri]
MNFSIRSYQQELLDAEHIPYNDLAQNLRELDVINRLLGGHAITIKGISSLTKNLNQPITILDLGSGGGDTLRAIARWARKVNKKLNLIGVDLKPECIDFARKESADFPEISFIQSDYRAIDASQLQPDIIISSLFCHHLQQQQIVELLQWMNENGKMGFVINDLHRHPLAYHSIHLLTMLFSKSYLVKNDAKLSVARGFKLSEWKELLKKAGISNANISWEWAFRHLITVRTHGF